MMNELWSLNEIPFTFLLSLFFLTFIVAMPLLFEFQLIYCLVLI